MQVVRQERARPSVPRVLADARPELEEHAERERAGDAVHDARGDRVVEAELGDEPAAGAPAPGGVEDPDDGAEDDREQEVGREPDALDQRRPT